MTRRKTALAITMRFIFAWVVIIVCTLLKVNFWLTLALEGVAFLPGYILGETYESWVSLGPLAMTLADEAAAELENHLETQIAEGGWRRLPPRQMFACAIARPEKPIVMYRGFKVWSTKPLSDPQDTRTGMFCWRYRP